MNRPKAIGTAAETAVVRYLRTAGFPQAERRALTGALDQGDITGTPGVCWEVKGGDAAKTASDLLIADWLEETEKERANAGADAGVLVLQRKGVGPANAGRWWAVMRLGQIAGGLHPHAFLPTCRDCCTTPIRLLLGDAVALLRVAGYGTPFGKERA